MKFSSIFSLLWIVVSFYTAHAQMTNIPDPNFEQALIDLGIDTNATPDGQVATADIDTIEQLNVSGRNISDLSGIEDFASLTSLNCASNRIVSLNLSANTNLASLVCSSNQLTTLDVSANTGLTSLLCSSNSLATLDVSQNTSLVLLDCSGNMLTNLDVTANGFLENLNSSDNKLTVLDVSENDSLRSMTCSKNRLTQLDLSNNALLQSLVCASNQLSEIDVSANPLLSTLDYSQNFVRSHDLSANAALTSLNCANNLLEYLAVNNGNNEALSGFDARSNPLLSCIVVDDAGNTGAEWKKDASASYAETCDPIHTYVPDDNFEQALIDMGLDTAPLDDYVVTDSIRTLTALDVSGRNIADLTGIEDFGQLATLDCSDNQITTLDFTKNTALTDLNCSSNDLTDLNLKNGSNATLANMDASTNAPLTCIAVDNGFVPGGGWQKDAGADYEFNCNPGQTFVPDDNFEQTLIDYGHDVGPLDNYVPTANIDDLTFIDLSGRYISDLTGIEDFALLESLDCSDNLLASVDLSNNVLLEELEIFSNQLSTLDVTALSALTRLHCGDNLLETLDLSQNPDLEELIFDSNFLTAIDLSNNPNLVRLNANSNKITDAGFDLTNAANLERLFCSHNKLTDIDISQNTTLISLNCSSNKLTALDVAANGAIEKIDCSQNFLTTLDLSANANLDTLNCGSNRLTDIDLNSNPLLRMLVCNSNSLASIDVSDNAELRFFNVSNNQLADLDVSSNPELIHLNSSKNELFTLDVTANVELTYLACADDSLSAIDLSQNTALLSFIADNNQLTALDLSTNVALRELFVAGNQLSTLDVAANADLLRLNCSSNDLTVLDLQNNVELEDVRCQGNALEELSMDVQNQLTALNCSSNQLTRLSVRNGANGLLETFNAVANPGLRCIEVDNPANIGSEWRKDALASYSDNCHYDETYVPDDNFEAALAGITGEPDNNDDYILTSAINALTSLDVSNQGISDLTGIQDFTSLQNLNISNNSVDSLYLGANTGLLSLDGSINLLSRLDLTKNKLLQTLDVAGNLLTTLPLDSLADLSSLACQSNELVELNLTLNSALVSLNCADNDLEFLRVDNGSNDDLLTFDATGNPSLSCIQVDNEAVVGAAWLKDETTSYSADCHYHETHIPDPAFEQALIDYGYDYSVSGPLDGYVPTASIRQVSILSVRGRDIADLTGIQDFEMLTSLDCSDNLLTEIDLTNNANLRILNASGNQLTTLDVSANPALVQLNASRNLLDEMDISGNSGLVHLNVSGNEITSLNVFPNTELREVNASRNNLFTVVANNGFNDTLAVFDLRNNPYLTCILVDDIAAAQNYPGWSKDAHSFYQLVCEDDDNDGVPNDDDLCPNTLPGVRVDLFGCPIFSLPANNFTILTTGESCRTGNNGKINITASQVHPFVATLTGSIDTIDYEFFDKVEIRNVRADTYRLCIRVIGQEGFEQCYAIVITEPDYLRVTPAAAPDNGRIAYSLSGSEAYVVEFNGLEFTTTDQGVSLALQKGRNDIKIRTGAACQGVFEETIYFSEEASFFPNPFSERLRIATELDLTEEVHIRLYSPAGVLIKSGNYMLSNGQLELDTSRLTKGIYLVEVNGQNIELKFKAIKQ